MSHQQWHQPLEKGCLPENYIGGPLRLLTIPVNSWPDTVRRCFPEPGSTAGPNRLTVRPSSSPTAGSGASGPAPNPLSTRSSFSAGGTLAPADPLAGPAIPVRSVLRNVEGKPGLNPRLHPTQRRIDLVLIQHMARRMMCLPRCSNVGLGSNVLRAQTSPVWMPLSPATRRAKSSWSTEAERRNTTGKPCFSKGFSDSFFHLSLARFTCYW
jgi:hypothetical protein